jgi:hypothetical protein
MNELLSDVRFWFTAMALGLLSLVKYLWNKQERRLAQLEADTVRRTEFERFRADMHEEHQENIGRMDGIKEEITGTNRRLDELLMRGMTGRDR